MKYAHIRSKEINTAEIKNLINEGDAIDTVRFVFNRYYNDFDLYTATVHAKYELSTGEGDMDLLSLSLSEDETLVYADWTVSGGATSAAGKLIIQVVAVIGDNTWTSDPATLWVDESPNPSTLTFESTMLEQYLILYQGLASDASGYATEAQNARDKSQQWAEEAEDTEVETGKYSAKHHAAKASQSASAASGSASAASGSASTATTKAGEASSHATDAGNAATTSQNARDKSQQWAEEAEDTEVETGKYSAKHHAAKASQSASAASGSASAASGSASTATTKAGEASSHATDAGNAATASQNARDKSQKWAEEAEDTEVETGKYSAKHHAAKADEARAQTAALLPGHKSAATPHQLVDQDNSTSYWYGLKVQNGHLIIQTEEVV